uniref:Uncharacterized protein n=1 Tax=Molossus molossus TaxID=27622 RepID=A0A7J8E286_MOLMO|nr:hypothetical protein HJG59_008992 [Molossus molossus]
MGGKRGDICKTFNNKKIYISYTKRTQLAPSPLSLFCLCLVPTLPLKATEQFSDSPWATGVYRAQGPTLPISIQGLSLAPSTPEALFFLPSGSPTLQPPHSRLPGFLLSAWKPYLCTLKHISHVTSSKKPTQIPSIGCDLSFEHFISPCPVTLVCGHTLNSHCVPSKPT